jgi:predicted RNA-binding Zn-ribbon protein involved in translation (DUF1610 family)
MDINYIKSVVQKILNKEFANSYKRQIKPYEDRINFACPYCGDSHSNVRSKRGNIWFNKLIYVCFNCDKRTSFDRLAKDFNEILDPDKKLEIIHHLESNIDYSDYENDFVETRLDDLISLKDLEDVFNVKKLSPIFDFKPVQYNSGIYKYLIGRGIPPNLHKDIYQAKYSKGDEGYEHIIVFLNRREDKVLGLQVRNLKGGKRRFFVIYNWEHLYRWVNGEDVEIDLTKSVIYNKLSYFFNILNVNFEKKITLFEGFLDSLFYPNSIGMIGVNTDDRFLRKNNLDLQYFYDNDSTGHKNSAFKIKSGDSVFLWKKLFNDIVERKKTDDPHKLLYRISKVKDLNKLAELIPDPYKKLNLSNYFSEDETDIRWIPKIVWVKRDDEKDYNKEFKFKDW